jgi:hypothetical protein
VTVVSAAPVEGPAFRSVALLACLALSCVYPTERGADLRVEMDPVATLLDGERDTIVARVMDPAGTVLTDIPIVFASSDPTVAFVTAESGEVIAAGPGSAVISAMPVGFEGTDPAVQTLLVKQQVAIDSIRPNFRRYGETVDVFGVGLSPAVLYTLGGAPVPIESWIPEDPRRPERFGILRLWVAPPAPRTSKAFVIKESGSALSQDSVAILPRDIFEPNDGAPAHLGTVDRFENPALFFEQGFRDDTVGVDWYRFTTATAHDRSVTIQSEQINTFGYLPILSNKPIWQPQSTTIALDSETWAVSPRLQVCQGLPIEIGFTPGATFRVAAQDLPASTYDILLVYLFPGAGYRLRIVDMYESVREPDGAEENDVCTEADALVLGGAPRILTIDNPYDPDWFSFSLDAASTVSFVVQATSIGTGTLDPDLDIRLFRNHAPDSLPMVAMGDTDGNIDQASATLIPGDYLLLVTDFAGVPTVYRLTSSVVAATPGLPPTPSIQVYRPTDEYSISRLPPSVKR